MSEAKGYTYILRCNDGSFYVGSTDNLERRFKEHQNGQGADYTKTHLPVTLIYHEEFPTVSEAFKREKQLQKWSHAKKAALVTGDIELLRSLSQSKNKQLSKNKT